MNGFRSPDRYSYFIFSFPLVSLPLRKLYVKAFSVRKIPHVIRLSNRWGTITLRSIPSQIARVSGGKARRNSEREPKKCRRNGRATENPEIRAAAIADAEHHVCNVTRSSCNGTGDRFKGGTFTISFNFFSRARAPLPAKGHALN